jgi:single-stranded DNA-binding protein
MPPVEVDMRTPAYHAMTTAATSTKQAHVLIGRCSEYGPKLTYSEDAKPTCSFTLIYEEAGRDGGSYRTYIPISIVGGKAESVAESLEAGGLVLVEGKLSYSN